MTEKLDHYTPGSAYGAQVNKDVQNSKDKWTLILVRELRHSPEKVWQALTDPVHLREWAPFVVDGNLATVGATVNLTWVGSPAPQRTKVVQANAPELLEYNDIRWELQAVPDGTRLTLCHKIDRRFITWGAAGWHICFDVLDRLLAGAPIARFAGVDASRFAGVDATRFDGWQRLVAEYAKQFGVEAPKWTPGGKPKAESREPNPGSQPNVSSSGTKN